MNLKKITGNQLFKTYGGTTIALVILIVLFSFTSPYFLNTSNLLNILLQVSIIAILALGMTFVLMIGEIDLSVASTLALSGVVLGVMLNNGFNPFLAILVTILAGILAGLFNGIIGAYFGIPTFIVTVATMQLFRGIGYAITDAKPISITNDFILYIGNGKIFNIIPVPVVILIVLAIIAHIVMAKTKYGRQLKMIGGNKVAAKYVGVKINKLQVSVFAIAAITAAISGILMASRLYSAQPNTAQAYELDAIASAVLGGTSLTGGYGTIFGTFIGALIIGVINNGMNLIGLEYFYQQIVKGLIIIIAVYIDVRNKRKSLEK
ncbi:ABC transporter permease [Clostridium sp. D2Q-11]|uniref:ABC transporter permease n=1 Tax=Anaeromonas frigoriresistens TaxID=2683708 RepID=A0A942Z5W2_9FIRM|nr:ABC transporter permease [Anaeromonas frigoriresistens]MBS4537861.1 ABC transporter permease [Anaeromonas frigoriresistens]